MPHLLAMVPLVLAPKVASAQAERSVDLHWQAPATCPDHDAVQRKIFSLLPEDAELPEEVYFRGEVEERDNRFHLRLLLRDGDFEEERAYEASTCDEVVGAATVAIALLMQSPDRDQNAGRSEVTQAEGEDTSSSHEATPADESESTKNEQSNKKQNGTESRAEEKQADPRDTERSFPTYFVAAPTLVAGFALFPHVELGLGIGAGVESARFRFYLSGAWYLNAVVDSSEFPESRVRLRRATASLSTCRWLGPRKWEIAPCLGVSLEYLGARGEGSDIEARNTNVTWLAVGPGLWGRTYVSERWRAVGGIDLQFQTARPRLVIEGQGELAQVGPLKLTTNLGFEWIF